MAHKKRKYIKRYDASGNRVNKAGKKIQFRKINFLASERRLGYSISLSPELVDPLKSIADIENMSLSWLCEYALADYFGVLVHLRKLKGLPMPSKLHGKGLPIIPKVKVGR